MEFEDIGDVKENLSHWWAFPCCSCLFMILMIGVLVSALAVAFDRQQGEEAPGSSTAGGGCYLVDSAFRDTSKFNSVDDILSKLGSDYPILNNKRSQIQQIITKSKNANINPALIMAIWSGEQSFGNDNAAFGCGVYGGQNRNPTFGKQLDCSLKCINKAIESIPPYDKPDGENIFTRLFYSYTGAMRVNYDSYGYVASENNPRIIILKKLVPDQVECQQTTGPLITGDTTYPVKLPIVNYGSTLHHCTKNRTSPCNPHGTGHSKFHQTGVAIGDAIDLKSSSGNEIYAVFNGAARNVRGHLRLYSNANPSVFALYAHVFINKTGEVKAGDVLGSYGNGAGHLHFELWLKDNASIEGNPTKLSSGSTSYNKSIWENITQYLGLEPYP